MTTTEPAFKRARTQQGAPAEAAAPADDAGDGAPAADPVVRLAVAVVGGRVGVAWCECDTAELFCMEAADELSGPAPFRLAHLAKLHCRPAVIHASARAEPELLAALRAPLEPGGLPFEVRLEKSSLFAPQRALAALAEAHVEGLPPGLRGRDRLHALNTLVSLSAEAQVAAAGALLAALARDGALPPPPPGAGGGPWLAALAEAPPSGFLVVDAASAEALAIFSTEAHPSAMGLGAAKEGFSVYGTLGARCATAPGRRLLRLWLARPTLDAAALEARLDAVEFLARRGDAASALRATLRRTRDAPRLLARLRATQGAPAPAELLQLQGALAALLTLRTQLLECVAEAEAEAEAAAGGAPPPPGGRRPCAALARCAAAVREPLVLLHNLVESVVEPDPEAEGFAVRWGVSAELDGLRQLFFGLPDLLTRAVEAERARLPRALAAGAGGGEWSIVFRPQAGFQLRLEGGRLPAALARVLTDWEFLYADEFGSAGGAADQSSDGAPAFYYRSDVTRQLDARFGDLLSKIQDMDAACLREVVLRLAARAPDVAAAAAAAAEADCLVALAAAARELRLVRPTLSTASELRVRGGRHLLTQQLAERCVPNDTHLHAVSAGGPRVMVVTGPNASGKSVYAKQVALIAFLARVGSFVPADEALVGPVDRIFTRVASREAAAVPQSTFMVDAAQVAAMLRLAGPRSLCVVDEFGKGTLACDGAALLAAALGRWAAAAEPPLVVLATHFAEVLDARVLPRSPRLSFHTMAVAVSGGDSGDVTFLYRLEDVDANRAAAARSLGVHCARAAGLPARVLARAEAVIAARAAGAAPPPLRDERLAARDAAAAALVARLLAADARDAGAARALLAEVRASCFCAEA